MSKYISALIGVFLIPLFSFGQYWEFGTFIGSSNYGGDLSPNPIEVGESQFAYGVLVRYNLNKKWTLKYNAYYGKITGSDERNAATEFTKDRNLDFRSNILDIGMNIEWNILGIEYGYNRNRFSPYLFGGFSVFSFDPEGYHVKSGEWVRLQPLGTEGQETTLHNDRQKYSLTQISVPFGFGLKFNAWGPINVGCEIGMRKTFTDYLDDVSSTYVPDNYLRINRSQIAEDMGNRSGENITGERKIKVPLSSDPIDAVYRGNPDTKDWYFFSGITLTFTILPKACYKF